MATVAPVPPAKRPPIPGVNISMTGSVYTTVTGKSFVSGSTTNLSLKTVSSDISLWSKAKPWDSSSYQDSEEKVSYSYYPLNCIDGLYHYQGISIPYFISLGDNGLGGAIEDYFDDLYSGSLESDWLSWKYAVPESALCNLKNYGGYDARLNLVTASNVGNSNNWGYIYKGIAPTLAIGTGSIKACFIFDSTYSESGLNTGSGIIYPVDVKISGSLDLTTWDAAIFMFREGGEEDSTVLIGIDVPRMYTAELGYPGKMLELTMPTKAYDEHGTLHVIPTGSYYVAPIYISGSLQDRLRSYSFTYIDDWQNTNSRVIMLSSLGMKVQVANI